MPSCDRSCGCSRGPNVEDGKWYGVRSYLHLFYEDCASTTLSDDPEGPPVLCPRRPWPSLCWKISLSLGTLLLLLGVAALTTGYAVPPKLEGIGEGGAPRQLERDAYGPAPTLPTQSHRQP
ncbi:neurensin 2 [Rhinolophus ferrumequinum]|uniref:Neurensin 2 n=1 Tax=Rhinolophus ferrumequinum TaxID=59479 RepID=A0A7J7S858_RHIFE|nr:neurensin 2 [Rhinolophus ferrumequinum]